MSLEKIVVITQFLRGFKFLNIFYNKQWCKDTRNKL